MTNTTYKMNPEVDQVVVVNHDSDGRRRLVLDVDADLSRPRRKTYQVHVIQREGGVTKRVLGPPARKKQSKAIRPMEKLTRRSARRTIRFMQDYLYLHDRSNKKKKNGWLRSYPKNIRKAFRRRKD